MARLWSDAAESRLVKYATRQRIVELCSTPMRVRHVCAAGDGGGRELP